MENENAQLQRRPVAQPVVQPPSAVATFQQHALVPRIQLARAFPREMHEFRDRLRTEVTTAPEGMVFWKPQTGAGNWKVVKGQQREHLIGPSVRMAEVAARLFTNLDVGEPKIEEHDGRVTATVAALDLESNVSQVGTSTTSLVDSKGRRMSAAVVSNLISATASKAKRGAIFSIIGKALFDELVDVCLNAEQRKLEATMAEEKQSGRSGTLWAKHVAGWAKKSITETDLLKACGVTSSDLVTPAMFVSLNASVQSVKEGIPPRVALGLDAPEPTEPPAETDSVEAFFAAQGDGEPTEP